MSDATPTNARGAEALQSFGYTPREARFLATAALHSGYFLRRQYCDFIGKEAGGTAFLLIEKLTQRNHASVAVGCNNTKIYHLCSRPFYAAIGEGDNRNRRERPPFAIKNRLMGLDFVLAHPENRYLPTEREKVDFFTGTLGVAQSELPTKQFMSKKSKDTTVRYFVDKYPIFVPCGSANGWTGVSFCYVDEGVITGSRFGNYLRHYRSLFLALKAFRIIYVAASDQLFNTAERDFRNFAGGLQAAANGSALDPQTSHLLEYFKARRLYESRDLEWFDRARLVQLREDRETFSGPEYEPLYRRWETEGEKAFPEKTGSQRLGGTAISATFSTYVLKQNYNVFGTAPRASNGA